MVMDYALEKELIESNPVAKVQRPSQKRRQWRILSPREIQALLRELHGQTRLAVMTLLLTGIRKHELQALRWADVDLAENVLRVRKSKSAAGERSIALSPALAEALWQHRRQSPYGRDEHRVFYGSKGGKYAEEAHATEMRAALDRVGITDRVRPFHDLRHTAATNSAAAAEAPIALMTKMGHTDMKTTSVYLHLAGVVFRDAAQQLEKRVLDLDADATAANGGTRGVRD